MTTAPNNAGRTRGFTLIELMTVIVIMAVMAAVIIPEMRGSYQEALLHSSARDLMDVCNTACSQAISANTLHHVRLDPRTGKYLIEKNLLEGRGDKFAPVKDVPGGTGQIDRRISIEIHDPDEESSGEAPPDEPSAPVAPDLTDGQMMPAPGQVIGFYPDGTADSREIVLQDPDGFRVSLRINPITAHVSVVELQRVVPGPGARRVSNQPPL